MHISKQFKVRAIQINCKSTLKIILKNLIFIFILGLLLTTTSYAQSASATWALTADTSVVVAGNITAPVQVLSKTPIISDTMSVRDYVGGTTTSGSPVGIAERVWVNGSNWPNETARQTGRYMQYSVAPVSGNNLTVQSVTLNLGGYGGAGIYASIFYSTDSTFTSSTQLYAGTVLPDARTAALTALSFTPGKVVNSGQTFYVRIFPWYNKTASPGKYILVTNFTISGTTVALGSPSITVLPGSLSFGRAHINTSRDNSFSISGTLLSPASGNITITAPTDFAVSTTNGSGYSSSITIPYSGSTLSDTTIYARFTPTTIASYNDSILVSGGGSTTQKVVVTGTGVALDVILGIFVSTTGSDTNAGTYSAPYLTIQKAISVAQSGDSIFVRAGTYTNNKTISISQSGTANKLIALYAYPPDSSRPLLDFSSMVFSSSNRGVILIGSYWHIKGLDIYRAGDNGMFTSGSHNIVEFCAFHENRDGGCQIGSGGAFNQFINCDSYFNFDDSSSSPGGNADGFAPKLDMGTGNSFYGCRSWQNSDDGWDGFQETVNDDTTYLTNCWTWKNGYLKNGTHPYSGMNGNGFKMGGNNMVHNFVVRNCLSFCNYAKGFDQNNGTGSLIIINCTAFKNNGAGQTYRDYSMPGAMASGKQLILENCISYTNYVTTAGPATQTITTCSWSSGFTTPSTSDFLSIDTTGLSVSITAMSGPRKADGSLPDVTFMHLTSSSQFVNAGTITGYPYIGSAPDLGCFESSVGSGVMNQSNASVPNVFALLQNYPNPFNPSTAIKFSVKEKGMTTLKVFDILGRVVATLFNETAVPNQYYSCTFEASKLSSGIYFSVLQAGAQREVKKMVLMK